MQRDDYGHTSVITDGQWMDSYNIASQFEKSQVYSSSLPLDEMWFEVDMLDEHVICAVDIYIRGGECMLRLKIL